MDDLDRKRKRDSLELSRTRIVNDLEAATHHRYRVMLENALAHLDAELRKLD
jgi:hypothetical protein